MLHSALRHLRRYHGIRQQDLADQLGISNTYLSEIDQPFREDVTNAELSRTRTRIRHDLLPGLVDDYNPNVADALIRLARIAAGIVGQRVLVPQLVLYLPVGILQLARLADRHEPSAGAMTLMGGQATTVLNANPSVVPRPGTITRISVCATNP